MAQQRQSHAMAQQRHQQAQAMYMYLPHQYAALMQQLNSSHMTFSRHELGITNIRDHPRVTLTPHQEQALAWLSQREEQHPCGGILADEAGLGKIVTMISLVLLKKSEAADPFAAYTSGSWHQQPLLPMVRTWDQQAQAMYLPHQYAENMFIPSSCTLVICPASLIDQWAEEVKRCCKPGQLNIYLYRGPNRERRPEELAKYDMVFMSYRMVWTDLNTEAVRQGNQPALLRVCWDRIILDEAHNIKNHKTETAILICQLRARARWAVIAYPIQNNTLEMFSFFRFLRFTPYADYQVWKKLNTEKLHTLVKGILWRTKDQQTSNANPIVSLPEPEIHVHNILLANEEREIYDQHVHQYRSTPKTLIILQYLMKCCGHLSLVQPNMISYLPTFLSTKIKFVIDRLKEIRATGHAYHPMKSVIVSQWTGMLDVVALHLTRAGFEYWSIRRATPPKKREEVMEDFNNNPRGLQVMLVSLRAGRNGLNLIGGNHLFFLDMHWNPALEDIVCDSICSEGQIRNVHIHKFVCIDTIEERMLELQDKKRQLAKDVLIGSQEVPSQADLERLFDNLYEHEA